MIKQCWKAIKVALGKEEIVLDKLESLGIHAYAPEITVTERRRGEWEEVRHYLLPGYILIRVNWTAEMYHTLKEMWYVQYPLAGTVAQEEVEYLEQYEKFAGESEIDYTVHPVRYTGPIAKAPERILKVDRRKGRVLLKFELGQDSVTKRWLPVKIRKST